MPEGECDRGPRATHIWAALLGLSSQSYRVYRYTSKLGVRKRVFKAVKFKYHTRILVVEKRACL